MGFFSGKKLLLLGSIVVLLAAIPLTVYFITQQQEIRSRATPATVLSLCDVTKTTTCETNVSAETGQPVKLDVLMDPGRTNQVSFVKLHITYDPAKLELSQGGLLPNAAAVTTLKEPTYNSGAVVVSLGIVVNPNVGVDITKSISSPTKIATITFKALAPTTIASQVVFGNQVVVYANNETGDPNAAYPANLNVLSTTNPALVTITGTAAPTPTPTPSGPTPTPIANQPPVCTALNVDRATSGTAPYSVTFTINGNDPNGTINKVTFDFGDGPVQNVTQNGGIGTNSVSTQMAHTYNNPGTYTATASLTDNTNAVSAQSVACTKSITVTAANIGIGTSNPIVVIAAAPTSTPTPTALPPKIFTPGPNNTILGIGALGTILTIIGGLLFLSL